MSTNLDELERKALATKPGFWISLAVDASDDERWADPESQANAVYIAAAGPLVTLALIARIRELEGALGPAITRWESFNTNTDAGWDAEIAEARTVLEKGAVLP